MFKNTDIVLELLFFFFFFSGLAPARRIGTHDGQLDIFKGQNEQTNKRPGVSGTKIEHRG